MPKLLVCQHVAFEILGTLNPLLRGFGFRIKYVNFGRDPAAAPSLDGYDGLILLGGPMRATQDADFPHLATEVRLIEDALVRDLPVLGICLGAQLVARALGAAVFPNDEKEIGWYDVSFTQDGRADPLFSHFRETEPIFQWHGDTFELPAGALHLATSATCENQAFRYGESVYGLQFHLEVDERLIERWLTVPVHLEELADLVGRVDPERIRCETRAHIERTKLLSFRSFVEFIRRFGACQRPAHPHR